MEEFTVKTKLKAEDRITKMLKRIARAFDKRGLSFSHSFGDTYIVKRKVAWSSRYIEVSYQDLTIKMDELSDEWEVLFTTVPADPNEGHGSNAVHMLNPTIDEEVSTSLLRPTFEDSCDHCTGSKRGRHKTITLRHKESGDIKTVGTSCLFEYTAIDPKMVEEIMAFKGRAEGGYGGGGRGIKPTDNIADFAIKAALWIHSNKPYRTGLGRLLMDYDHIGEASKTGNSFDPKFIGFCSMQGLPPRYQCDHELNGVGVGLCNWSDADSTESAEIDPQVGLTAFELIDYATNLSGSNSFEFNCRQVWSSGVVSQKTAGIAGGVVASFLKNRTKLAREAQQAKQVAELENNRHLGAVGDKHDFGLVQVDFVRLIDGYYGATTLTKFLTPEGDLIVWFRSGNKSDLQQGQYIKLSGTVKKHDDYKGRKQTVITRGKLE